MQEYDPNNIWQQFRFVGGKLRTVQNNGGYNFFKPHPDDARDTSKCTMQQNAWSRFWGTYLEVRKGRGLQSM